MTTKTKRSVKQTTIWFVGDGSWPPLVLLGDTERVTFHNDYVAVSVIDKYGDEKARTWYPWHTILRVEETWL